MKLEKFKEKKNKKKSIIIFTISGVLLIVGVFFYESFALFETRENFNFIEGNVQDPGDLYFAYYVEDKLTYEMPSKDSGYILSNKSSCTNGVTISWNEEEWDAIVHYKNYKKETNSRVKCILYFEKKEEIDVPETPINESIEQLIKCGKEGNIASQCFKNITNLESMNLEYDDTSDKNLRFVGLNVNNYIDIGDRDNDGNIILWRIIGVMNNIKTEKTDSNGIPRLKIIRNISIGKYSWNSSTANGGEGANEWSVAALMKLMNPGYETETVGGSLYWNRNSGTCYTNSRLENTSCNFSSTGLSETAKEFIDDAVWNTGSNGTVDYQTLSAKEFYDYERSTNTGKICSSGTYCNDNVSRTTTWTGKIGLPYPSDYGYATSGGENNPKSTCLTKPLYKWSVDIIKDCKNYNWLKKSSHYWTITPEAKSDSANRIFMIYSSGAIENAGGAIVGKYVDVYPTAYLISNIRIINGDGSSSTPFTVSLT